MTLYAKDLSALTMIAKVDDLDADTRRELVRDMSPSGKKVARALENPAAATPEARKAAKLLKKFASKDLPGAPIFERAYAS